MKNIAFELYKKKKYKKNYENMTTLRRLESTLFGSHFKKKKSVSGKNNCLEVPQTIIESAISIST